jgi:uncharacterized protein (TIGR02391 family)
MSTEKPDNYRYQWMMFYPDTLKFYLAALRHYRDSLEEELRHIGLDPLFSEILGPEAIDTFPIAKEAKRFGTIIDRLQSTIDEKPDAWDYELNITHSDVRVLKSVGLLYLAHLRQRRNDIGAGSSLSVLALQAIDTRLSHFEEKLQQGAFAEASPYPLLVDPPLPSAPTPSGPSATAPPPTTQPSPPRVASGHEILDPQLRERCLDLFYSFSESGQAHRYDTVLAEATRILEDRVRRLSGAPSNLEGVKLVANAFAGDSPPLVLSEEPSEQEAAHLLFRGLFGFIRNPFHHRLIDEVPQERAIQVLTLVDYLIFLAESARQVTHQAGSSPERDEKDA